MSPDTPAAGSDPDQPRKFEAIFTQLMPGAKNPQTYRIEVEGAEDPSIAMVMAIDKWNNLVAPRDVRIREVIPKEE